MRLVALADLGLGTEHFSGRANLMERFRRCAVTRRGHGLCPDHQRGLAFSHRHRTRVQNVRAERVLGHVKLGKLDKASIPIHNFSTGTGAGTGRSHGARRRRHPSVEKDVQKEMSYCGERCADNGKLLFCSCLSWHVPFWFEHYKRELF